jgi:hypothetical protein
LGVLLADRALSSMRGRCRDTTSGGDRQNCELADCVAS